MPSLIGLTVTMLMFILTSATWGNRLEFEESDVLPEVKNVLFTGSHVGMVSQDGRLFTLDRQTQTVQQVDAQIFSRQFPKPWPPAPSEIPQSGPMTLRSSAGEEFQVTPAYCSEGEHIGHAFRYKQQRFPDVLKHCTSVAALEIIGPQVWLGTIHPYEGGEGEAEGVVVQALDRKQKLAAITRKSGLTSGPIRMLRDDPFTKTVWVATERGVTQIDRQLRVIWARYWYEDFDPSSGRSRTSLITTRKSSNVFAVLGRELGIQDWQAYGQVVQKIPPNLARWGDFKGFQWLLYYTHMSAAPGGKYFSQALNGLLPFFIQAAESTDGKVHTFALLNVCKFDDARVPEFVKTLASKTPAESLDQYLIADCLNRLAIPTP